MSSANVSFIPAFGANYSPLGRWGTPLSATRAICSPGVPTSSPYMGTGIIQSMVIIQLSRYFSPLNVPGPHPCLVQSQLQIRQQTSTDLFSNHTQCSFAETDLDLNLYLSSLASLNFILRFFRECWCMWHISYVRCPGCSICHLYRNHHPQTWAGREEVLFEVNVTRWDSDHAAAGLKVYS